VPLLRVHILEGRPPSVEAQLVRGLTEGVERVLRVLGSSFERISVLVSGVRGRRRERRRRVAAAS